MMEKVMTALNSLWNGLCTKVKSNRGQNTVEYLLMLTVIVGIVLIVAAALKGWFPLLIAKIKVLISGAASGAATP